MMEHVDQYLVQLRLYTGLTTAQIRDASLASGMWIAMDASGEWFSYTHTPICKDGYWITTVYDDIYIGEAKTPTMDWTQSLLYLGDLTKEVHP